MVLQKIDKNIVLKKWRSINILILSANHTVGCPLITFHQLNIGQNEV